jgi:hypothetical protein
LPKAGLKFLTATFRTRRGGLNLIFRDGDCLSNLSQIKANNGRALFPASDKPCHVK